MTVYLVPGVFGAGDQILDSNGKVAAGALVNTYAAGTVSPVTVFTTAAGNVSASNPIVTNADGRLPYELWQTEGQAIKIILTDALANTLGTYDNLRGINDPLFISGIALLNQNNVFTAQNTFSNISANQITVTSITLSTLVVNNITVSTINVSSVSGGAVAFSTTGVMTTGIVPLARMERTEVIAAYSSVSTPASSQFTVCTVTCGSVNSGDRVFVVGIFSGGSLVSQAQTYSIIQAGGTAVISNSGNSIIASTVTMSAAGGSASPKATLNGILRVTGSGTLIIGASIINTGTGPINYSGELSAIVLNNG